MINESPREVSFPVMKIQQPIGDFFVGVMKAKDLIDISWFDIRKLKNATDFDEYLGIQRRVSEGRVREIADYVKLTDATFPTGVILAVEARCAELKALGSNAECSSFFRMTLKNIPGDPNENETVLFRGIARVLDGQHRIKGLKESGRDLSEFEINVCVFVDADIADQATIFSTVNLAQTKVNRSLVYDLLAYSQTRSPERTCHSVTVVLDKSEKSPFLGRIKRLGVSTEGRFGEVLTQATVVKSLLPYISQNVLKDRDIGRRVGAWDAKENYDKEKLIFRHWFINDQDDQIAVQLMHYFEAVKRRWTTAWSNLSPGNMMPRTNGFRGFMTFLRPAYNSFGGTGLVKMAQFKELFDRTSLKDDDFIIQNFPPGTGGESKLFHTLMEQSKLGGYE